MSTKFHEAIADDNNDLNASRPMSSKRTSNGRDSRSSSSRRGPSVKEERNGGRNTKDRRHSGRVSVTDSAVETASSRKGKRKSSSSLISRENGEVDGDDCVGDNNSDVGEEDEYFAHGAPAAKKSKTMVEPNEIIKMQQQILHGNLLNNKDNGEDEDDDDEEDPYSSTFL